MNHEKYLQLTWKEKNERIGKCLHLYQNVEAAFDEMNKLIDIADEIGIFKDIEFFPPTPSTSTIEASESFKTTNTNQK